MNTAGRWIFTVIGLALLGLSFTPPLSVESSRSIQHGWQLGHVLLFFSGVYLAFPLVSKQISRVSHQFIIVICISTLLALAIETLQIIAGRDFSVQDMVFDLCGSMLALSFFAIKRQFVLSLPRVLGLHSLSIMLLLYCLLPLAFSLVDESRMQRQFPVLSDFESRLELGRWQGQVSHSRLSTLAGERGVMQANFDTRHYSTVTMTWLHGDWQGYHKLKIDAYVPAREKLSLVLRIHDSKHFSDGGGNYHDRFNRRLLLHHGWNHLEIKLEEVENAPRGRQLDLSAIQQIALFSVDLPVQRRLFIDSLRLE